MTAARRRLEAGSTSLELVLLAPVLLGVMLLIAAFGRHANVQGYVDQAARDAARTATTSRSYADAKVAVASTIDAALASAPDTCRNGVSHEVTSTTSSLSASDPYDPQGLNVLTITVSCPVDVSDLSFIGIGEMTLTSTFSSPMPAIYGVYE